MSDYAESTSSSAPQSSVPPASGASPFAESRKIALVGNPNVGKTSVFNRLTNLRAKTSNFSGTTVEVRRGQTVTAKQKPVEIIDLPGIFSLDAQSPDERVSKDYLSGTNGRKPDAILLVVDATNLQRSLFVAGEALQLGIPSIVAVNMIDSARSQGINIDINRLSKKLECPVVGISARTGEGMDELRVAMEGCFAGPQLPTLTEEPCMTCSTCPYAQGHQWAASIAREVSSTGALSTEASDRIDRVLTHPVMGLVAFALTMLSLFVMIFWLASYPMDWLDSVFGQLASLVGNFLPSGDFNSLVTDGIIGGVGGVIVFLPQICILFFVLTVLEDSGYLSRAVVVVDRWMRRVGLPGQAFVPLLAAHACAIPAIMATKTIENRRDRLAAILVIPLMTCSARLPVYSMIAAMLFPANPLKAAMLFASAYALGMVVAFAVAWVLKLTMLPGNPSPLILDLPPYRRPSLRNALRMAYERGLMFVREAGTIILMISVIIWGLSTYPKMPEARFQERLVASQVDTTLLDEDELNNTRMRMAQEYSLIGRAGKFVEPVFSPLGFDWKTSVGVLTSFAAREVVVSTMSVLYGLGDDTDDISSLREKLTNAKRDDGTKVFNAATCVSLLVFFVLAMQCLPTQAVTKRETGSWKWAVFQLTYMTILAYVFAFGAYNIVNML